MNEPTQARWSFKQKVALNLAPPLAALLIRLLGMTLRYRVIVEPGGFEQKRDSPPGIYCFWHRCLLPAAHMFRGWNIGILISRSFDGELIARTVERLGFRALRGSSSRGGGAALLAARDAFASGANIAFTADGPRGPRYHAKPGAVRLAQIAGADHVGAFYLHPQKGWQLNSWDGFLIPKPFSSVVVSFARVAPILGSNSGPEITAEFGAGNQAVLTDSVEPARARVEAAIECARHAAERGAW